MCTRFLSLLNSSSFFLLGPLPWQLRAQFFATSSIFSPLVLQYSVLNSLKKLTALCETTPPSVHTRLTPGHREVAAWLLSGLRFSRLPNAPLWCCTLSLSLRAFRGTPFTPSTSMPNALLQCLVHTPSLCQSWPQRDLNMGSSSSFPWPAWGLCRPGRTHRLLRKHRPLPQAWSSWGFTSPKARKSRWTRSVGLAKRLQMGGKPWKNNHHATFIHHSEPVSSVTARDRQKKDTAK